MPRATDPAVTTVLVTEGFEGLAGILGQLEGGNTDALDLVLAGLVGCNDVVIGIKGILYYSLKSWEGN